MRHDYDLPPDWAAITDKEKSDWMTRERCRRLNKRIQSKGLEKHRKDMKQRVARILRARGYLDPQNRR